MEQLEFSLEECDHNILQAQEAELPEQEALALAAKGQVLAFLNGTEESLEWMERAVGLLQNASNDTRAGVTHSYGAVWRYLQQWEKAERAYLEAQTLRSEALGKSHPILARSYLEFARLTAERGDSYDKVLANVEQGITLIERFIVQRGLERDSVWFEAWADLCTLESERATYHLDAGHIEQAHAALSKTFDRIQQALGLKVPLKPAFLDSAVVLAGQLRKIASEEKKEAIDDLSYRLQLFNLSGPTEEVQERLFWRRLHLLAREAHNHGIDEAEFAQILTLAAHGKSPQNLQYKMPELLGVPHQLSERLERSPHLLAEMLKHLGVVNEGKATVEAALHKLEEFCVSCLKESNV